MASETASPAAQANQLLDGLSAEDREKLSKVLFPQTDTTEVVVLGKHREVHPLPIKVAQRLRAALKPMMAEMQAGMDAVQSDPTKDYDAEDAICRSLEKTAEILAEHYGWDDVKLALAKNGLSLEEYQALAVAQVRIGESNNFLLEGLRTVIRWMQVADVMMVRFQSTLTGQR